MSPVLPTVLARPKLSTMKRTFLCLIALWATAFHAISQLPDGSIAPNWTATDINGDQHQLYSLLDEGKQVILVFDATWNSPGWYYMNTGFLQEIHALYGPNGTDEVRVFFLESDPVTGLADLNGTGSNTQGDWVSAIPFPIIDNAASIFEAYGGAYYPTIFTICPNRILTQSGQVTVAQHTAILQANDCQMATLQNDPTLVEAIYEQDFCAGEPTQLAVSLMNNGLNPLTSCDIGVFVGGENVLQTTWYGQLATYEMELVELGSVYFDATTTFTVQITSMDQESANNQLAGFVEQSAESELLLRIQLMVDDWPEETGWGIFSSEGDEVFSVPVGSLEGDEGTEFEWWVELPDAGCYFFQLWDAWGDGMRGSLWGSIDGYCEVTSWSNPNHQASVVYVYDGSYEFSVDQIALTATMPAPSGCTDETACNFDPNAEVDDASCTYPGCLDASAWNYAPDAGCEGECMLPDCAAIGEAGWLDLDAGTYPALLNAVLGVAWSGEWVVNIPGSVLEPFSQVVYPVHHFEWTGVSGMPEWVDDLAYETGAIGPNEQRCIAAAGTPSATGTHTILCTGELFISIFGQPFSIGVQSFAAVLEVAENPNPIPGCTYAAAMNFVEFATFDDGSCLFAGCTDEQAGNFNPLANFDDGTCGEACATEPDSGCASDSNGDGQVTVSDLLTLLGEFGASCN